MKQTNLLTRMLLLCALIVGSTSVWAKDVAYLTLTFPDDNSQSNGLTKDQYKSTWVAKSGTFEWSIANFNNNNWNSSWTFIKCGNKTAASTCTITTKSAIDTKIYSVVVTVDKTKNCSSNKLEVASNAAFDANLQKIEGEDLTTGDVKYTITNPAANMYYRLTFEQDKGSNGDTQISKVVYNTTPAADDAEPAAINTTATVWNLNSSITGAFTKNTNDCNTENTLKATDNVSTITYMQGKNDELTSTCLKPGGKSTFGTGNNPRYFVLQIANSGVLTITSDNNKQGNYLIYQSQTNDITAAVKTKTITTSAENLTASGSIDIANGNYVYIGWETQVYTVSLSWAEADGISITTTANMEGWRAFNPDGQGYTLDADTKAYVVTAEPADGTVKLVELAAGNGDIPGNTPVILKTSADDYKMVLTKKDVANYSGDANLLKVTSGSENISNKYRLGYNSTDGVAFFPYSETSPAAGIVYLDASSASAKGLAIVFEDSETTGIEAIYNAQFIIHNDVPMYNLAGQQVSESYKGIVIVNGKKYVRK